MVLKNAIWHFLPLIRNATIDKWGALHYLNDRSAIAEKIKSFLEAINIKTTVTVADQSQIVSVKDIHSLRQSFCYYAGLHNIPLAVVKSIIGHMSPEMIKYYTISHTIENSEEKTDNVDNDKLTADREKLKQLIDTLPHKKIQKIFDLLEN